MGRVYAVRLYKRTDKWAIYYLCPHAGHVYLDPRFDSEVDAKGYVVNVLGGCYV